MARRLVLPLVLYAALALASTWPLAIELGDYLAAGAEPAATVPYASAWALWWTANRAGAGFEHFWDAPIFAPGSDTFALSEPMPLLGVMAAPVLWLGGSLALAHGLVLLTCLTFNGWSMDRLLRKLGAGEPAALAGGAMAVLLPYVHYQLGVLTFVPVFGIVWTLHAAVALLEDPRWWRGALLGAALATTYLMSGQHALFTLLCVPPAALWLVHRPCPRFLPIPLAVAGLTSAILIAPIAVAQLRAADEHQLERTEQRVRKGSASLTSYVRAPSVSPLPLPPVYTEPDKTALFPGFWKLALAVAGVIWLIRRRRRPRLVGFLITLIVTGFMLSLLPRLAWGWFDPWSWLRHVVPGLDQIRSPFRLAVMVHLGVVVLAAFALDTLIESQRRFRAALVAVLALLAVTESWPRDHQLVAPPSQQAYAPLLDFIDRHVGPDDIIVHVPFPGGGSVEQLEPAARAMYLATYHGRPIANGYSSYWPASYRAVRRAFSDLLRGRGGEDALRALGIRYVVVHTRALRERGRVLPADADWSLRFRDPEASIEMYELGDGK